MLFGVTIILYFLKILSGSRNYCNTDNSVPWDTEVKVLYLGFLIYRCNRTTQRELLVYNIFLNFMTKQYFQNIASCVAYHI